MHTLVHAKKSHTDGSTAVLGAPILLYAPGMEAPRRASFRRKSSCAVNKRSVHRDREPSPKNPAVTPVEAGDGLLHGSVLAAGPRAAPPIDGAGMHWSDASLPRVGSLCCDLLRHV